MSEEQTTDVSFVRKIRESSWIVFQSLCQVIARQPELRKSNLATKRKRLNADMTTLEPGVLLATTSEAVLGTPIHIELTTDAKTMDFESASNEARIVVTSSSQRTVSSASIADPNQDSAGGSRVWASKEKASDIFANVLIPYIMARIWPDGIILDWVQGRTGDTLLEWNNSYVFRYFHFS